MVVKGNLHADGRKLAAYLITGKKGERAELVELRGFASSDIHAAFIDVHIQAAEATQCEKPFFHSYVRLPEDEELFREQWKHAADRIEKQLGFEGQGRAIAFHHQPGGNTHMHIAWSRIDLEQHRARDPGLYKNKLKEIARQLECELGLTRISSERPAGRKTRAPGRKEFEQARRLGTDICSGAQSKCGGRAIKGTFRRTIGENIGDHERTLAETECTLVETDARSRKTDAHYLRLGAIALSS